MELVPAFIFMPMVKAAASLEGFLSGELAQLTGVSTDTLRDYERKGVLPLARRLNNVYRWHDVKQ
jgi:hypothetical protein